MMENFDFESWQSGTLVILVLAFILAFILAFAVGANDSANSFGTAVGSKAMTFRQAWCLGAVCEMLGAMSLSIF